MIPNPVDVAVRKLSRMASMNSATDLMETRAPTDKAEIRDAIVLGSRVGPGAQD